MPKTLQKASGCVRFNPREHYPLLQSFYKARGRVAPNRKVLPTIGYVSEGRVIGFLYQTDSNVAMIEGIISDPNTVPSSRRIALARLAGKLIDTALAMGYTNIFAITNHPAIETLCEKLLFKSGGTYKIYTLSEND